MFTTKYSKDVQKPATKKSSGKRCAPAYQNGGKVEKEFDTIRDPDGSKTMIRKGVDPLRYGRTAEPRRPLPINHPIMNAAVSQQTAEGTRKIRRNSNPNFKPIAMSEYEDD